MSENVPYVCVLCIRNTASIFSPHTLMSLARLSRELISRPSLQACKQEITFWVSMRPGRIVRPDRLPWKYWVNLGVATSPPNRRGDKKTTGRKSEQVRLWEGLRADVEKWVETGPLSQCQPIPTLTFSFSVLSPAMYLLSCQFKPCRSYLPCSHPCVSASTHHLTSPAHLHFPINPAPYIPSHFHSLPARQSIVL